MEVRVLGPLELRDDRGELVAIPGGRPRLLLGLLALDPGKVTLADRLIDDLWGAKPPQQPANALQIVVFKLRRAIGVDLIETRPPGYALALSADSVDAYRFEQLLRDGGAALAEGMPEAAVGYFDEALAMWRGPPLVELGDAQTAITAASRWEELRTAATEDRFDALLAMGRAADLVPDLDAAIAASPFRERLRGQLMLALYRSGRQADALRAYSDARGVLAEELGLEPSGELKRLEAAILSQDEALDLSAEGRLVVDVPSTVGTPTNLRPALTSFVGRERDIAGIGELLDDHRLVTLVGAGGCGKTRLASEFAASYTAAFPDGVWFVALDSLVSGDGVVAAVASALGLSTADTAGQQALAGLGILDRVQGMLSDRSALVVLDNCEHVIDEAARVATELLVSSSRLRLLATSREALRVPGEMVWRVPPLSADDAISLFADRARAATSQFELSGTDHGVVSALCDRLDGMPLAIELAAARTSAFTITQLAARLDDRFRLLTGGARTALPRQQTLRAVADWSYDLLFDDERKVFEGISVFAGGCSLEAVEAVCSDDDLPAAEVDGLVGRLVDKSLVVADGSGRLRLLQSLAQYGRERLAERGGGAAVRDRHAAYFRTLGASSYGHLRRAGERPHAWWLASLTTELDNIRAALEWSIASEDGLSAQLLAGHMGWYWWQSGRIVEGYRWLERAVACPEPTPPQARAPAVAWAARLGLHAGQTTRAAELAAEALEVSERAGDHVMLGIAWSVKAQLAILDGHAEEALDHLDRAQRAADTNTDPWSRGIAALMRAQTATMRGELDVALGQAEIAISTLRAVGDVSTLVSMLDQYSRMLEAMGRADEAEAAVGEARDLSEAFGLRGWQSTTSTRLGSLALARGDLTRARELHRLAVDLARDLALPTAEIAALDGLGVVNRRNGDFDDARRCHLAAQAIEDQIGRAVAFDGTANVGGAAAFTWTQLGYVAEQAGDLDEAWRAHGEALTLARKSGSPRTVAIAIDGLAGVAAAAGDGERAAMFLGHAAGLRVEVEGKPHADDRSDRERAERLALALLGDEAYRSALEAGRGVDIDVLLARGPRE